MEWLSSSESKKLHNLFASFKRPEQFVLRKYLREMDKTKLQKILENWLSEKEKTVIKNMWNFRWRMKNLYYITNEDGDKIKFTPNFIQRKIILAIFYKNDGYIRHIILKYRQWGVSTLFTLLLLDEFLWWGTNIYNVIIAHERKLLISLFKKIRYALDNIEPVYRWFLPVMDTDNANELYIRDDNNRLAVSLDTRWETPTRLHITELAWREASKQWSLLTTVNPYRKTKITIESTANGVWNPFYNLVMTAREEKWTYKLLFYPWYIEERNRIQVPEWALKRYTDKEKQLRVLYDLDDEQVYWRRLQIQDAMAMWEDWNKKFDQENPDSIDTAFVASGTQVFELSLAYKINKPEEEIWDFKIFGEPEDGMVFGIDTAEWGAGWDYSVIVWMSRTWKVLVTYRKRVEDFQLVKAMDELYSLKYKNKYFVWTILIERNKGTAFVTEARHFKWFYLILKWRDPTAINDTTKEYYWFYTWGGSKELLIRDFRKWIYNKQLEITEQIYKEISTYIYHNRKAEAMSWNHDDMVMAAMIAYHWVLYEHFVATYSETNVQKEESSALAKFDAAIMSWENQGNTYSSWDNL